MSDEKRNVVVMIKEASYDKEGKYFLVLNCFGEEKRTDVSEEVAKVAKFKDRMHSWPIPVGTDPASIEVSFVATMLAFSRGAKEVGAHVLKVAEVKPAPEPGGRPVPHKLTLLSYDRRNPSPIATLKLTVEIEDEAAKERARLEKEERERQEAEEKARLEAEEAARLAAEEAARLAALQAAEEEARRKAAEAEAARKAAEDKARREAEERRGGRRRRRRDARRRRRRAWRRKRRQGWRRRSERGWRRRSGDDARQRTRRGERRRRERGGRSRSGCVRRRSA